MHTRAFSVDKTAAKNLDGILEPLLNLFTERYSEDWGFNCLDGFQTGGAYGFALWGDCDGRLVELPDKIADYPLMARALATLLCRTGTVFNADKDCPKDEDPCRGPLRFSITKKVLWDDEHGSFLTGTHLLIDHFGFEVEAAERQIALLVKYLGDEANLLKLTADDLMMF